MRRWAPAQVSAFWSCLLPGRAGLSQEGWGWGPRLREPQVQSIPEVGSLGRAWTDRAASGQAS